MKTFETTRTSDWTEVLSALIDPPLPTPVEYTYTNESKGMVTLASHFGFPPDSFKKFCDENAHKLP